VFGNVSANDLAHMELAHLHRNFGKVRKEAALTVYDDASYLVASQADAFYGLRVVIYSFMRDKLQV